ncbi:MAG: hypothetical protein JXA87_02170 [Thermoleophilia bacterium]|nr:hypothetical protein [Thermoleophilia bacterium]
MSRTYWRVSPAFWSDEKVTGADGREPWSDDTKLLALYLLTCEHRTLEGLFRLPKGYILEDLGWTPERLAQPFAQLLADGFIEYDERARLCLIVNALDYQTPDNPNQTTAAIRLLEDLPKSPLFARLFEQAKRFYQPLAERLRERLPERLEERFGKPPAPAPAPALPSGGAPTSGATPVDNSPEPEDDFRDIDFGEDDPPEDHHTDAQKLTGFYVDEHARLGRSKPTRRQTGIVAQVIGEKLGGGAEIEHVREAIRRLVERGKPPSILPAMISEVEAERTERARAAPRDTFPPPEPPMTPEQRAEALRAAQEGRKKLQALARGVGRAMTE